MSDLHDRADRLVAAGRAAPPSPSPEQRARMKARLQSSVAPSTPGPARGPKVPWLRLLTGVVVVLGGGWLLLQRATPPAREPSEVVLPPSAPSVVAPTVTTIAVGVHVEDTPRAPPPEPAPRTTPRTSSPTRASEFTSGPPSPEPTPEPGSDAPGAPDEFERLLEIDGLIRDGHLAEATQRLDAAGPVLQPGGRLANEGAVLQALLACAKGERSEGRALLDTLPPETIGYARALRECAR